MLILAINLHMGFLASSVNFHELVEEKFEFKDYFIYYTDNFFVLWQFLLENWLVGDAYVTNGTAAMIQSAAIIC